MTKNNLRQISALLLAASVLGGCVTSSTPEERGLSPTARDIVYTRFGECRFADGEQSAAVFGGVLAALAASAVTTGLNYLGQALAVAGEGVVSSQVGRTNIDLQRTLSRQSSNDNEGDRIEPTSLCIQVIRAPFEAVTTSLSDCMETFPEELDDRNQIDRQLCTGLVSGNRYWDSLPLAGEYSFFFEGGIRVVETTGEGAGVFWSIVPTYVELREPLERAALRQNGDREVAIFISFDAPGQRTSGASLPEKAGVAIVLGRVKEDEPIRFNPIEVDLTQFAASPFESNVFSISSETMQTPLTASVLITETQGRDEFIAFLAQVFSGAQAGIASSINTEIGR